jgi:hypothetical protein
VHPPCRGDDQLHSGEKDMAIQEKVWLKVTNPAPTARAGTIHSDGPVKYQLKNTR